ncbi:MAG: nucleotide exchange factor GrpE [Bacteroidetes bacterium]|nr:nucleotide exchange factor GrpE [Bacteroidota bacterium]
MKIGKNKNHNSETEETKTIKINIEDAEKSVDNTNEAADKSENNASDNKLEKILKEKAELEEQLKRKAAEFENYRKRTEKEKLELIEYGNIRLMTKFLTLLDDITNAKESALNTPDIASIQKGVDMIYQKASKLFEDEGVKQIETKPGDDFNVDIHEAILRQPSEYEENKIVSVLQPGYTYKEKILRYVKVSTSSGNEQ